MNCDVLVAVHVVGILNSLISNVCDVAEVHYFQAMKIVDHYANSCFDWLSSEQ